MGLHINGIRGFTLHNMHSAKNAYPWIGCKGADTVVILKWLRWFVGLQLQDQGWSPAESRVLNWVLVATKHGLAFSQGIHGHGVWLVPSCVKYLQSCLHSFGICYAHLADHCMRANYCLYGMVPKLHAFAHFRADMDDALADDRSHTLNPATFDNSMSEDFIGKIARMSRRVSFKNIERTILQCYQVKAKFEMDKFKKRNQL